VRVRTQSADWHRETLTIQGRTEADKRIDLRAEAEGRIVELTVSEGDRVAEGDLLARVDPRDKPARLKEARARLAQREAELEAAERLSEKGFRARTQLAKSRAEFEQAEAQVRQAEVALQQTRVTAPFAGRIGDVTIEPGDYVSPGQRVMSLIDLDPIRLVTNVSERNVDRLELGQQITARTVNGQTLDGIVSYIAAEAEPATRTFRVEAEAQNADEGLRGGMTIDVSLPLEATRAHFVAPSILTLADDGTVGVKTLDGENTVHFKPITILADAAEGVWITGLPETVTFVTVGQAFVDSGQTVRPTPEAEIARALPDTGVSGGGDGAPDEASP
jgi:multidrug efflux system membrane fusion protein